MKNRVFQVADLLILPQNPTRAPLRDIAVAVEKRKSAAGIFFEIFWLSKGGFHTLAVSENSVYILSRYAWMV